MSWAFACLVYKEEELLKKFTYVVCVEKCVQDWWSNCAVFDAVLQKVKEDHPHITKLVDKHDNAGCYHNCHYWLAKKEICDHHKITLEMTLMNEPCKGKDECDRMISKCRNHLRYYVNAGNSVKSATAMRNGLTWLGGVKGVSVAAVTVDASSTPDVSTFPFKIPDVTKIFVIEYKKDHIQVRRSFGIGMGSRINLPERQIYQPNFTFLHEFADTENAAEPGSIRTTKEDDQNVWHCPNEGCTREFRSVKAMRRHTTYELCTYQVRRSSMDVVKALYAERIEVAGESSCNLSSQEASTTTQQQSTEILPMGWALKERKPIKRFSAPMLNWVKGYFLSGEMDGKKVTGDELNRLQRVALDENEEKLFPISEYKTDVQFKSLLSRLTVLYKQDKDAFSHVAVPGAENSGVEKVTDIASAADTDIESMEDDSNELPTYDDEYAAMAALASELDGSIADLKVGDYISFAKTDLITWLPGVIDAITPDHCIVKAMKSSTGESFVWPTNGEIKTYTYEVSLKDMLCIIEKPVYRRRYWSFTQKDVLDSNEAYLEWKKFQM